MGVRIKKKKIGENFLIPLLIKMLPYLLFNQNVTLFTIEQDGGTKIYDKIYDNGEVHIKKKGVVKNFWFSLHNLNLLVQVVFLLDMIL